MLIRFLMALLLAACAMPAMAVAPCHDAPAMAGVAMPHGAPALPDREHKAVPVHACIGCVPPSSWRSGVAARMPAAAAIPAPGRIARIDLAPAWPPATPPPRASV